MLNEIFYTDIVSQPKALSYILNDLRNQLIDLLPTKRSFKRIFFTGSGDSLFAPLSIEYLACRLLDATVEVIYPMEAAHYQDINSSDIIFTISFSGETFRTIEAAERARRNGAFVVAITGNPDSTLSTISHASLLLKWQSKSRSIPHTVDFTTTLLAIVTILETFQHKKLEFTDVIPDLVLQTITETEKICTDIGNNLCINEFFYFLGAGPSWGIAQYGAAKFWEACGIRAQAFELEEFAHGPHKLIDPGDPVFLVAPDGPSFSFSTSIAEGIASLGANPFVITNNLKINRFSQIIPIPQIPEFWSPFLTCIPLQFLSWAIATTKGYDVVVGEGRVKDIRKIREIQNNWIRKSDFNAS
jgi:glucosamine 6-phosphate synthetase-like amidotransferase/phosphosugar isomerase protein